MRYALHFPGALLISAAALWAQDYKGPVPPKADVPYLLHASTLVEVDAREAHQETKKDETTFWIEGTASPTRTPLAEPIFIMRADKLRPEKIELYRFTIKKDRRELTIRDKPKRDDPAAPLHLSVTKVGKDIYRIEASEVLANGEYSLSPSGSNEVFSFQVY